MKAERELGTFDARVLTPELIRRGYPIPDGWIVIGEVTSNITDHPPMPTAFDDLAILTWGLEKWRFVSLHVRVRDELFHVRGESGADNVIQGEFSTNIHGKPVTEKIDVLTNFSSTLLFAVNRALKDAGIVVQRE